MATNLKGHTDSDDALLAWRRRPWQAAWPGFRLERRNAQTRVDGPVRTVLVATPKPADLAEALAQRHGARPRPAAAQRR